MTKEFFQKNRSKLASLLDANSCCIVFSGHPMDKTGDQQFSFEVNKNFYYLTGINQDNVVLVLAKNEKEYKEMLFIQENDPQLVKWVGAKLEKEEASSISGIDKVFYHSEYEMMLKILFDEDKNDLKTLYLDLETKELPLYNTEALELERRFKKERPSVNIKDVYNTIISLRRIKSEEEIDLIKQSIKTTKEALDQVMLSIHPGMFEYQAEAYFDVFIKVDGNKDHAFDTICAAGKNATVLHYTANNTLIKDDELVLFDLGCRTNFYISDISRTYPANGKFTPRQKEIYNIVLNANKKCEEFLKPGVTFADYYKYAKELLADGLKKIGKITKDEELVNYYWHSVGHPIGLDTHDPVDRNVPMVEGMIITDEPGLYLEDEGIGIRIEDNILITKDGCINLSKDIIKEVDDIEKFMEKSHKKLKRK